MSKKLRPVEEIAEKLRKCNKAFIDQQAKISALEKKIHKCETDNQKLKTDITKINRAKG